MTRMPFCFRRPKIDYFANKRVLWLLTAIAVSICCLFLIRSRSSTLRISENQCWKGSNDATLQLRRLDDLKQNYELQDFLEGPGLTASNDTRAACKFVVDDHTPHFPHAAQQLYRCFSWWQEANQHPTKKEPYLIMPPKAQPLVNNNPFISGLIAALRKAFGVRVVKFRHNLKVVRPIVDHSYDWNEQHSFAMRSPRDARTLRKGVLGHLKHLLPSNTTTSCRHRRHSSSSSLQPRIGILDRHKTRHVQNVGALVKALESSFPNATVRVYAFEDRSFEEQVIFMSQTDILISPHGAQLTSIPFLGECSQVLELFPAGYLQPYFYGSLAAVSGVGHAYLYLGGKNHKREQRIAMKNFESRQMARASNLCPVVHRTVLAVQELVQQWQTCCHGEH